MEEQKPLISVIVPAYNVGAWLPRCLDSILGQTYENIEIVVVDDGSVDGTAKVLDGYAERYPSQIKALHIPNGGVTNARLTGVESAAGEWIGFVDGDDEIEPDMYEFLLNNAINYKADISHCGYQMVFEDGRIHYFHNTGCLAQQDKPAGLSALLDGSLVEPGLWNKLFHKTLFHSLLHASVMDTSIKINEDLLMNYYLFSEANFSVFEDQCKYHYIVRKSSASRQKLNEHKIYDPIRVKQIIRENAIDEVKAAAQSAYFNTCINVYNGLITAEDGDYAKDQANVAALLKKERTRFGLLGKKRKLMAQMIANCPALYQRIYKVYERYFQKKVYD